VEKPYSGSHATRSSIRHVIFHRSKATVSGNVLRAGTMRYTTTPRSVLSAACPGRYVSAPTANIPISAPSPACGISAASASILLSAPRSSLQRHATGAGILLPAASGKGPVTLCVLALAHFQGWCHVPLGGFPSHLLFSNP